MCPCVPSSIRPQSAEGFFNETLINTGALSSEDEYIIPLIIANQYMPAMINHPTLSWMDILFDQIITNTELAHQLTAKANRVDQIANTMAIGVSITTVASILVVAMANRLDKKEIEHQFSKIRADILNDETVIIPPKEKLAIFVLINAGIISLVGLAWPLYLTTLPLDITEVQGGSLKELLLPATTTTITTPPTTAIVSFATVSEWPIFESMVFMGLVSLLILSLLYRRYCREGVQ